MRAGDPLQIAWVFEMWHGRELVIRQLVRAFLMLVLLAPALSPLNGGTLEELRWKKRVVVIYAPPGSEGQLARQEQSFRAHEAELKERDVMQIVLRLPAENQTITDRFKLAEAGFTVLLIGKDGGEKLRSHGVVAPATLCDLIDSMPMRQEEVRK